MWIIRILFLITIFGSLMTQLPSVLNTPLYNYLKYLWILMFLTMILVRLKSFIEKPLRFMYLFVFLFLFLCLLGDAFTTNDYFGPDLNNIFISLLVCITSYSFYRRFETAKFANLFCLVLVIGAIIISLELYLDFFVGYNLMSRDYAYQAKNSIGPILFCCGVIVLFLFQPRNRILLVGKVFSLLLIIIMIFLLKSRATLVCFFYVVSYIIFSSKNTKLKYSTFAIFLVSIIYIFSNESVYDIFVNGILFAGRDVTDLDELSSSRTIYISDAFGIIPNNFWFGIGVSYLDCMPIAMVLQFGIIGATIIFTYIFILYNRIRNYSKFNNLFLVTNLLLISFLLNSLFEAQPPFGPGMKCFLLWVVYGFSLAKIQNERFPIKRFF